MLCDQLLTMELIKLNPRELLNMNLSILATMKLACLAPVTNPQPKTFNILKEISQLNLKEHNLLTGRSLSYRET